MSLGEMLIEVAILLRDAEKAIEGIQDGGQLTGIGDEIDCIKNDLQAQLQAIAVRCTNAKNRAEKLKEFLGGYGQASTNPNLEAERIRDFYGGSQ